MLKSNLRFSRRVEGAGGVEIFEKLLQETWDSALWCNQSDHAECCPLSQVLPTHTHSAKCSKPPRTFPRPVWSARSLAVLSTRTCGGTGPSHRDSSQQTQGSPLAPTSKSVHSLVPLPRTCFDTFLLIIQVSTHNASEITVLVSLSAYSGTWVYSFLKDTFTKCFLGMAVPEQSNNPNHCHCHFQTSRPQSLLPQHSLLSKMIYWLAHFLTFHPKKSIFTLLSTPLQELKARLGISKPCYLNVCIKYKWHARVKHLLCINPSDATYTPNLIDSTPFGNFKSPSPYF